METEKKGINFLTTIWKNITNLKDDAALYLRAKSIKKDGSSYIKKLTADIDDMEEDFVNKLEKMAIKDGETTTFEELVNIRKNIEQNKKVLKIAQETYFAIFNENI